MRPLPDSNTMGDDDDQLQPLEPDASELIICEDRRYVCETYIFEPAPTEVKLGRLYAVGETEDSNGIGHELLDLTVQALQKEYYRDPSRGILASFESALHQANLVLHDATEQGVRDWMGHFHVALGILAGTTLHVSAAGDAGIYLVRKSRATALSEDLAYSPITNPLRTFSQVASGNIRPGDTLFFGTAALRELFRPEDLTHFALENTASTITTRLQQLYADQGRQLPLAVVAAAMVPAHRTALRPTAADTAALPPAKRDRTNAPLRPRQPLVIHRSLVHALVALLGRFFSSIGAWLRRRLWPLIIRGSKVSGRAVAAAGAGASRNVQRLTRGSFERVRSPSTSSPDTPGSTIAETAAHLPRRLPSPRAMSGLPGRLWSSLQSRIAALPRSSKFFAAAAAILAVVLVISVVLLLNKRAADESIQQASETLHDVRTKTAAAETALIYDNRDEAQELLAEARSETEQLLASGLYADEAREAQEKITTISDRLQKITRASTGNITIVGDFNDVLDGTTPHRLTLVADNLYSFHPTENTVVTMNPEDGTTGVVTNSSAGIGFLQEAIPHEADKTITFITDAPGIAILDTLESTLQSQEIAFSSSQPAIGGGAVFGSRLYLYDSNDQNIYSYSKVLRGYGSGSPWLVDPEAPRSGIISIAVDGSIYALYDDGAVREFFKGEQASFELAAVEPSLSSATALITGENLRSLYVFDPTHQRVVVFSKTGELEQQLFIDIADTLSDIAVAPDETTLYALDGTRVLRIPLTQE